MAAVASHSLKSTVVIDAGTGFTKLGYSGNLEPSFVERTEVMCRTESGAKSGTLPDLDFYFGEEATAATTSGYEHVLPVKHGRVVDWNLMERVWHRCVYQLLRCDPSEHAFLLTESPLCTPEDRETTAEIFFETFNAPHLYIATQAVLSLAAASCVQTNTLPALDTISGVAVESGEGVTSIVPVVYGYTIGSAVRTIPLAGKDITLFIFHMLRARGEPIPAEIAMYAANYVKENHGYCALHGMVKEYKKFDLNKKGACFKSTTVTHPQLHRSATFDVGYEQFLGPEMFFNPEIFDLKYTKGVHELIDEVVLACPLDTRRALYSNVVLSGGNTLFSKLATRLQKSIDKRVQGRLQANRSKLGAHASTSTVRPVEVKVEKLAGNVQKYAVWLGGSLLASQPRFTSACITKQQYDEEGPRVARAFAAR